VFAELYHRRWGIETDFRRLKQTLTLDNFSGRSVTAVKQDFHAAQLLKNLALLMQHLLQPGHRTAPQRSQAAMESQLHPRRVTAQKYPGRAAGAALCSGAEQCAGLDG
jgi:IS4 transposase